LIGIGCGYGAAAFFGQLSLTQFHAASWFGLPAADWPGVEFHFRGDYWPVFIAFLIATVAGTIETVGDAVAVQKVSQRNFRKVDYDSVQGALYADGVGNFLAGLAGTTPNTTYSSNISLLELNGVASRRVGLYGAIVLCGLAFFPKLTGLILDVPAAALGAATFVLIGMLFVTGLQVATMEGVTPETTMIISVAFWGGFAAENELFFANLIPDMVRPLVSNAIATGSFIALLLATLFQLKPLRRAKMTVPASLASLETLQEFAEQKAKRFGLDESVRHDLQLCCEEVFVFLCEADAREGPARNVFVRLTREEDTILVELADRSTVEDVDLPRIPDDLGAAGPEELGHLGLVLVSKLAHDVNHLRISGWNYISFRLMRSVGEAV
jgi:NCS2 family nucleobase:cation symporter-2/xanthine permease XanP